MTNYTRQLAPQELREHAEHARRQLIKNGSIRKAAMKIPEITADASDGRTMSEVSHLRQQLLKLQATLNEKSPGTPNALPYALLSRESIRARNRQETIKAIREKRDPRLLPDPNPDVNGFRQFSSEMTSKEWMRVQNAERKLVTPTVKLLNDRNLAPESEHFLVQLWQRLKNVLSRRV